MFRLFGCLVVQLFGCSAVQLLGRSAESVGRPRDGSTSPEMPVAFRRFCPESGSDSLSGPAFRTCFRVCFPDAGAILFDCGMRSVVPIRPQDSSAQFLPQQLPAAGV